MQHLPPLEVARRALRAAICPACYQRPPHSETLPPSYARSCEPRCALFQYVGQLQEIAHSSDADSSAVHLDVVIRDQICNDCCNHATADSSAEGHGGQSGGGYHEPVRQTRRL